MKRRRVLAAVVSAALCVIASTGAAADAQAPRSLRLEFSRDVRPSGDIRLAGRSASRTVTVNLGERWRPTKGSLSLVIRHSPDIDPDRSFVSVTINYAILRSLRLDPETASGTAIVLSIPPALLKSENEIEFAVEQYARPGASQQVWTTVDARSFMEVEGVLRPAALEIAALPDSFVDLSSGQRAFSVLVPQAPASETLEATALLVATVARGLTSATVRIDTTRSSRSSTPLLIVGTPREQPIWAQLRRGLLVPPLREGSGVIGLVEGPAGQRILFATGDSPEAVHRAAAAPMTTRVAGRMAVVAASPPTVTRGPREWIGYVPPRNSFTLADLHIGTQKIPASADVPLNVPLHFTPDARFLSYGHRMTLRVSVNPAHLVPEARLRVEWNDVRIGDFAAAKVFKGTTASLDLAVPPALIRTQNTMTLAWTASSSASMEAAAWLLSDSEFYLPRYYQADLPDLGLLRWWLYPFTLRADMSDVVVVLPDRVDDALFGALLDLSAALGRIAPTGRLDFGIRRWSELTEQEKKESHLIVLDNGDAGGPLPRALASRMRLPRGGPVIQEVVSPWNAERYVLALSAPSGRDLRLAVVRAFNDNTLSQLSGDAAALTARGPVVYTLARRQASGSYSYLTASEAWLRTNWAAFPLIMTFASAVFFLACRVALIATRRVSPSTPEKQ